MTNRATRNAGKQRARARRRARAAARLVAVVNVGEPTTWEVVVHSTVNPEDRREPSGRLVTDAVNKHTDFEAAHEVTDTGVDLIVKGIRARTAESAKRKAQYWLDRCSHISKAYRWRPVPLDSMEARECA